MKYKSLFVATLLLFAFVNTGYFWEGYLGAWNMMVFVIQTLLFLILTICLCFQLIFIIKEKISNIHRVYLAITMIILLGLILISPRGLINFEQFESKDLLVATHEGSANCTVTLKLKEHQQFCIRNVCFGVEKASGTYQIHNDTIQLKFSSGNGDAKAYQFGIFKKIITYDKKPAQEILLYMSKNDTLPCILDVVKNNLIK